VVGEEHTGILTAEEEEQKLVPTSVTWTYCKITWPINFSHPHRGEGERKKKLYALL